MSTADHEVWAALQADIVAEHAARLRDAQAEIARLREALIDAVVERAGFVKQPDGTHRRDANPFLNLFGAMPLSAEQAIARLADHGIQMQYRELPDA